MIDIARDNPMNQDIGEKLSCYFLPLHFWEERRTGARLELVEGRPMLVKKEYDE